MGTDDRPLRIGDAERRAASELLRRHLREGRLTPQEYGDRVVSAEEARWAHDLEPLFADLPDLPEPFETYPHQTVAPHDPDPTPPRRPRDEDVVIPTAIHVRDSRHGLDRALPAVLASIAVVLVVILGLRAGPMATTLLVAAGLVLFFSRWRRRP